MSTKADVLRMPGSCLNKAETNEPVFVLRANDPVAAQTIRLWAAMSAAIRSAQKIDQALVVAADMEDWVKARATPKCATEPVPQRPGFTR